MTFGFVAIRYDSDIDSNRTNATSIFWDPEEAFDDRQVLFCFWQFSG